MNIQICQQNFIVGNIRHNKSLIIHALQAADEQVDILVFPELCIVGYPAEDLILRPELYPLVDKALSEICLHTDKAAALVGHPVMHEQRFFNAVSLIADGKVIATYYKQLLPNYSVFDEKRLFTEGHETCVVDFKGVKVGLLICEDLWHKEPAAACKAAGAELILSPNASPFHTLQTERRQATLTELAKSLELAILYVNQVGGQDELVFDGQSMAISAKGELQHVAPLFKEQIHTLNYKAGQFTNAVISPEPSLCEKVYSALVLSVKDYVNKNGFKGAVIGLSGGIDSALTLAVAADALGAENVTAVMMPFKYTSDMSQTDAAKQAELLGVNYHSISIEQPYHAFMQGLSPLFDGLPVDTTEENLQSRCRGVMLMAISNKTGSIVLTTGNKSEMAVGYATLYGDMAGGFCVLKDVPKTLVFELAEYRNQISPAIPQRVIDRPPSAELAPDQVDEDSLPPYDVLDQILEAYVEDDLSLEQIAEQGFDMDTVKKVCQLVDINEHKRRQAAPGVRITKRAFGRDRRYPITSGFRYQRN